ncbi:MAG TPA: hypothetical protein VN828_14075 [Acidobacteriaceae bacterium]|nr:hypothetical protein [Acidobacteriaceae bacterium]
MRGPPYRSPIDASGLGINGNHLQNGVVGNLQSCFKGPTEVADNATLWEIRHNTAVLLNTITADAPTHIPP